jgi:chromosome segregation ATPase
MSDRLTYEEFSQLADKLYFESVEMPTSKKTYDVLLKGSLTTHQHYLIRWKNERKHKPLSIPEQLEQIIVLKGKEYAELLWQHLKETYQEEHTQIQQNAETAINEAQELIRTCNLEREAALKTNIELNQKLLSIETENKILKEKLYEHEKLVHVAEEMQHNLEKQLQESQENVKAQMAYFTSQQEKYNQQEQLLKQQLKEQAEKHQVIIVELQQTHQKEKTGYQSKLKEAQHNNYELEKLLQKKQSEYDKLLLQLEKSNEKIENLRLQWDTFKKEYQTLTSILQKNEVILAQKNTELHLAQLQLTEAKEKISNLEKDINENHWHIGKLEEKLDRKNDREEKETYII